MIASQEPMHPKDHEETIDNGNPKRLGTMPKDASSRCKHEIAYRLWNRLLGRLFTIVNCLWIFPLLCSLLVPLTSILVFVVAFHLKQLEPILPYLSDLGTLDPQAGFFAMMMDLIAFLICVTVYLRYCQMRHYIEQVVVSECCQHESTYWHSLNWLSSFICHLFTFGLVAVGNFRMSEWIFIHLSGAACFFVAIYLYGALQVYISWNLALRYGIESKPISQLVFLLCGIVSLVGCFLFSLLSMISGGEGFFDEHYRLFWTADKPGYVWHLLATSCEWITINSFPLFNLCTFLRMKRFNNWHLIFA